MIEIKKDDRWSGCPWRLLQDGREMWRSDVTNGFTVPVCAATKAELVRWCLDRLEWYVAHQRAGLVPDVFDKDWRERMRKRVKADE